LSKTRHCRATPGIQVLLRRGLAFSQNSLR
jgi:hypothetical protein